MKGGIAVIDLDEVAKAIGRTQDINNTLQVRKNASEQALQKAQADAKDLLEKKKEEFGETPTDEQQKQLAAITNNLNNQLVQGARGLQSKMEETRQSLITSFRSEIKPIAQKIALEKGLAVVIPKNEGFLLAVDPGVDITGDVIKACLTRTPSAPAAAPAATAAEKAPAKASEVADRRQAEQGRPGIIPRRPLARLINPASPAEAGFFVARCAGLLVVGQIGWHVPEALRRAWSVHAAVAPAGAMRACRDPTTGSASGGTPPHPWLQPGRSSWGCKWH